MTTPALSASPPDAAARRRGSSTALLPFRRLLPARSVLGFFVLLALLFALSYTVGGAVGPVAPGLHPADRPRPGTTEQPGSGDSGDMSDMPGMAGMSALGAPRAVPAVPPTVAAARPALIPATRGVRR